MLGRARSPSATVISLSTACIVSMFRRDHAYAGEYPHTVALCGYGDLFGVLRRTVTDHLICCSPISGTGKILSDESRPYLKRFRACKDELTNLSECRSTKCMLKALTSIQLNPSHCRDHWLRWSSENRIYAFEAGLLHLPMSA